MTPDHPARPPSDGHRPVVRRPVVRRPVVRRRVAPTLRRLGALVAVAVLGAVVASALGPAGALPQAAAAPGAWGAGSYPYLAGTVCTSRSGGHAVTSPLASWDLGAGREPGFLTSTITSDGSTDSAAPPLATVGSQTVAPVAAGSSGFASSADIATYAALISHFGSGTDPQVAEVADAVARKASGAAPGCVDTGAESALLRQAAQLAGPYQLSFARRPARLLPGVATPLSVTLSSAAGRPVPGAQVTFAGSGVSISGPSAVTNSAGVATVRAQVPTGTPPTALSVTARATLPSGLDQVNAEATPSSTDPSGSAATALVAAPGPAVVAQKILKLNLSAHPVMHLSVPAHALDVGASATPRATITGMYGHSARVVFTIRGPLALSSSTFCGGHAAADFGSAVAATSTLTIHGDSTATAGTWQPTKAGCYWVSAALTTLDAVPKASAHASLGSPVTVLGTSASLGAARTLLAPGQDITGRLTVAHDYGLGGQVTVRMLGPVQPPPGGADCSTADFSTAATAGTASRAVPGDTRSAVTKLTVPSPSRVGCYQLTGHVDVSLPGGPTVRVPIADPDAPRVLVVHPVVTYAMNRIWSYQRGQVSADVTVIGTFGQPVHVALRMMHIPDANLQCRNADYAAARPTNTGPAVAARANLATVRVRSGPLTAAGCYRPVPVLTMDANRSITATGSFDALLSAVAVGPDPNAAPPIASGPAPPADRPWLAEICTAAAFVLLCLCAFGYAVASARRTARLLPEHDDQLLLR